MSEQGTVKVYELAKELGIDSLSLVDKLKGLSIQVKNHMSELEPVQAEIARSSLRKGTEAEKPARKASTKAPGTKTAATGTKMAAATATKARKKAPSPEAIATEATSAPTATAADTGAHGEKKAASPIIRRRMKADGNTETLTHSPAHQRPPAEAPASLEHGAGAEAYPYSPEAESAAMETHEDMGSLEAPMESQTAAEASGGALTEAHSMQQGGSLSVSSPGTVSMGAMGAGQATSVSTPRPIAPFPPRPVAPRRSILKIVEPSAPPPRPMFKPAAGPVVAPKPTVKGTTTQDKDGFRIIKMTKENLDQMVEEEAAKKRGAGGREAEIRPEDVRFADYRKKEMIFLPKKKKLPIGKEIRKTKITQSKAQKRVIEMQETIGLQDLANQLSVKAIDVVRKLMQMGQMANMNSTLDFDTATLIAGEYQYEIKNVSFNEKALLQGEQDKPEELTWRPPVVTIMGHVDHGKTTLLDAIREADVAGGEAGGITQHIGAYTIEKNGKLITFIDTPGHEAFSVMRARGANVTDIVILVVSADDGVMPQTREAVSHAQAAKVPIIVAVNKIDKAGANPDKIKQGLSELNLLSEDWGGETMFIPVSALKRTNLDKLLDAILLQAEVLDLKANASARADGTVLEARIEKGRGPMASVLVSRGTLRVGDPIVSGSHAGKVKALTDDKGRQVKEAGPGIAVEVLGFEGAPNAGEKFNATETDADARDIAGNRIDQNRAKISGVVGKMSLDDLFSKIQSGDVKELGVVLKADVFGSVEAIRDSLQKLSTAKVKVKVIYAAPGGITESDVLLASASNALIIGFNVRPETKARQLAEAEHIEIKNYNIIYELLDDIRGAMTGLLDKKKVETFLGRAEVRQTFSVPKIGTIAGSSVVDGKILRGANVRLLRDSRIIFEGKMSSLKRFKDDAKEVATGFECGIGIENYNDLKPGDIIEAYQIEMVAPGLDAL